MKHPCEKFFNGNVVIYHGDNREVALRDGGIGKVDHVITDAPYEKEIHEAEGRINRVRTDGYETSGFGFEGLSENDRSDYSRLIRSMSLGWALIFTLAEGVRAWRDELQACGAKFDTTLAWIKPDAAPRFNGQGAARGFECIVTAWCGKGYRKWNGGGKRGVFTYPNLKGTRQGEHPTEKPLDLMLELVFLYTQPGQTVADIFLGSGTTALACALAGRKCVGIEANERFFELACTRLACLEQGKTGGYAYASRRFGQYPTEKLPLFAVR